MWSRLLLLEFWILWGPCWNSAGEPGVWALGVLRAGFKSICRCSGIALCTIRDHQSQYYYLQDEIQSLPCSLQTDLRLSFWLYPLPLPLWAPHDCPPHVLDSFHLLSLYLSDSSSSFKIRLVLGPHQGSLAWLQPPGPRGEYHLRRPSILKAVHNLC